MIHHVIREDLRSWDRQLPFLLFAYREVPNTTTGVSPFRLLYGREARGPLAILKSSWAGEIHLPTNISQSAADYLQEMKINMEKAAESASLTAAQKQKAYGDYFNKRSSVKNFSIGEQVVLLIPDSSNKIYARWTGPGEIIQHHPPHSYKVKLPDGTPFVYRIPESLKIKVDEQIEELVRLDLIEESDAEIAYPIVCVNKKDGTLRLCVDFRALNSESVSDDFPMEDAVELIHSIGRANIITTLDLLKGYWAIPMAEDSKKSYIFQDSSATVPFQELNFTVNLKKCAFGKAQIKYLGHIIGSGKHEPDPEKTAVINNLPVPKTKKELRSVLGLCNYYREYIPKYSELVYPLTELTKKRVPDSIPWTEKHDSSFHLLKKALVEAPSLYSPVPDKPYTIHSDASQIGIAACLSQKCGDKCYPIAYASQKLSKTQQSWSTIEREAFAIVWSLKKFEVWVFGTEIEFYTDHNPLPYLTKKCTTICEATTMGFCSTKFNVTIKHCPGVKCLMLMHSHD
ncbi:retrovirus-related Pol polyprotein from transposon 17.6 [Trichonephila clavipes]|nr:retrovirus-related Pol polyprotein from transposon 17.6 [Trichonephila clavipes]